MESAASENNKTRQVKESLSDNYQTGMKDFKITLEEYLRKDTQEETFQNGHDKGSIVQETHFKLEQPLQFLTIDTKKEGNAKINVSRSNSLTGILNQIKIGNGESVLHKNRNQYQVNETLETAVLRGSQENSLQSMSRKPSIDFKQFNLNVMI